MQSAKRPVRRLWHGALSLIICLSTLVSAAALPQRQPRRAGATARKPAAGAQRPAAATQKSPLTPQARAALDQISAASMRGHLSFIASDLLEGRKTPSRGLDIAAEYIAAQFRRAGLEPAGDDGYFQTANWAMSGGDMSGFEMRFADERGGVTVGAEQVSLAVNAGGLQLWPLEQELSLSNAGVVKVDYRDVAGLAREQVAGKVVVTEVPDFRREDRSRWMELLRAQNDFLVRMRELGAGLVVAFDRANPKGRGAGPPRLVDPEASGRTSPFSDGPTAPFVTVHGAEAARLFDALKPGATAATLTFRAPSRGRAQVRTRNVAGLLRGSDPALRDTYVIVSAHYDHLGVRENCAGGDCVFNGANDDGSGTVAVIEVASALARMSPRPKRSILFLTFFGEELGLVGSRYYGRRPLVPLEKTVAQINLEQVGRTDDSEGPQLGRAALTGFDFSEVGETLRAAGAALGFEVYRHPTKSDSYFSRSDNQALADLGVPAHTLGVAFEFPDYHAVGDHWEKIDYQNMERVVRAVALGALVIAGDPQAPRWNESNPKTAKYVEAWKKLQGKP